MARSLVAPLHDLRTTDEQIIHLLPLNLWLLSLDLRCSIVREESILLVWSLRLGCLARRLSFKSTVVADSDLYRSPSAFA